MATISTPQTQLVKAGLITLGGIAGFFGIRAIVKKLGKPPGRDLVVSTKSDVDKILEKNASLPPDMQILPTYTPSQMKTFADTIERAMKGPGTNEKVVNYAFSQMKNDIDVMLLIESFGVRDDDNLSQWLEDDGMVEDVNKVLATKTRITYRF